MMDFGQMQQSVSCYKCHKLIGLEYASKDAATREAYAQDYRFLVGVWWCLKCAKAQDWPRCERCSGFGQVSYTRNVMDGVTKLSQLPCRDCNSVGKIPPKAKFSDPPPWERQSFTPARLLKPYHVAILVKLNNKAGWMIYHRFTDTPKPERPCWSNMRSQSKEGTKVVASPGLGRIHVQYPSEEPKLTAEKVRQLVYGGLLRPYDVDKPEYWDLSLNGREALLAFGFPAQQEGEQS